MNALIIRLMQAVRHFTAFDFAIFKIGLLSIGILLGVYFADFFLQFTSALWFVAIAAFAFMWIQTIKYLKKKND